MTITLRTKNELLHLLGARLRAHRLEQRLAQRELAAMAGVSTGAIRVLEGSGMSSLDTLVRVTQALGLGDELEGLFVLRRRSIAELEQAEAAVRRQRAPRRRRP